MIYANDVQIVIDHDDETTTTTTSRSSSSSSTSSATTIDDRYDHDTDHDDDTDTDDDNCTTPRSTSSSSHPRSSGTTAASTTGTTTTTSSSSTSSFHKFIQNLAVLGDSSFAVGMSFGLFLLSLVLAAVVVSFDEEEINNNTNDVYDHNKHTTRSTTSISSTSDTVIPPVWTDCWDLFRTTITTIFMAAASSWHATTTGNTNDTTTSSIKKIDDDEDDSSVVVLGPIPDIGPARIFQIHQEDEKQTVHDEDTRNKNKNNILSREMIELFEQEGVLALRGLLEPEVFHALDTATAHIVTQERHSHAEKERTRLEQQQQQQQQPRRRRSMDVHNNNLNNNKSNKPVSLASKKKQQFFKVQPFALFSQQHQQHDGEEENNNDSTSDNDTTTTATNNTNTNTSTMRSSPFVQVAMLSKIPQVVADLMRLTTKKKKKTDTATTATTATATTATATAYHTTNNDNNTTIRILRDIFLAKDEEEYICGWHVDDVGFWPALVEDQQQQHGCDNEDREDDALPVVGINAWIALDDMPVQDGGGLAVAVGSHHAAWKDRVYELTGSTHTYPTGGYTSSHDIVQNRPGHGTCNIQHTGPRYHQRMEETKRIYDIQRTCY